MLLTTLKCYHIGAWNLCQGYDHSFGPKINYLSPIGGELCFGIDTYPLNQSQNNLCLNIWASNGLVLLAHKRNPPVLFDMFA